MERQKVSSSSLIGVGYDAARAVLQLEFTNGHVYEYYFVPRGVYQALLESDSKGRFVNARIRSAFPFTRVS